MMALPLAAFALGGVDMLSDGTIPPSNDGGPASESNSGGFVSIGGELTTLALQGDTTEILPLFGTLPLINDSGLLENGPSLGTWTSNPTDVLASLQNLNALIFDSGSKSGNSFNGDQSSSNNSNSNSNSNGNNNLGSGPGGIPGGGGSPGNGGSNGSKGGGNTASNGSSGDAPCQPMPECGWTEWTPPLDPTPPPDQAFTDDMGWPMGSIGDSVLTFFGSEDTPPNSEAAAVPEPSSLLLLGSGVVMLAGMARHRIRRR